MAGRPRARRRLLVLGAGPAQLGLLDAARARDDVHVIAVDRDPRAVGFTFADERAVLSSEDEEAVDRLARAREVDGIVSPGADWPVGIAARVAERIGLVHPISARTGSIATSKARQREAFAAAGVLHPRELDPRGAERAFPVVVKAPDRQGQRGLTLVRSPDELEAALATALAESRGGVVLAEEHVEGPEVTVNAVSIDGRFVPLTVTDRLTADLPAFGVALAHAWPSVHDGEAAVAAAAAAVEAVGVRHGPSYTQLRLGPGGRGGMGGAARLGGGHDAELCAAATGVDLNALAVAMALGERPSNSLLQSPERVTVGGRDVAALPAGGGSSRAGATPSRQISEAHRSGTRSPGTYASGAHRSGTDPPGDGPGGVAIVFLVPPAGRLVEVEGIREAEALPGVRWVRVYRRPGHVFGPFRRGADRAGAVLVTGADRDDALERGRRAADAVRFRVDADAS